MAQGIDALAALQGENDRLRAQLDEVEALRAREAKANVSHLHLQSALAAGSIVGAWNWHPARDAFILDEGFAKVFGLDATFVNVELPIDRVLVNLHPEDRPGLDAAIAEAVARGGVYVHQYRIKRSDGKYYWVEGHGRVDYDAEGTPVSFPGIVIDVNDRRGVEAERNRAITALRESEARVRAMVDQSSAGIAQTTLEGKFIFVNNRFCTMTGRSREELLTLHMHQLTHPDDRPDNVRRFQNLAQGGSSFEMETRYLRSDNSIMWVHNSVTGLRDADGTANSLFAVSLDISEQKSLQLRSAFLLGLTDRLRTEESAASIMAATANLLGAYLGASRVGYSIVQPNNQTIVFESSYVNGVPPLTGSQALDNYDQAAIAAQRRGETFAVSDTCSLETHERWALIDSRAFISVPRIRDGRFKASFYVNYQEPHAWSADEVALIEAVAARTWDAVERAQAEAALRHAHDNLEQRIEERSRALQASQDQLHQSQKMEAIGQLTGGIAHDFNNMLATITSSLELMNRRIASGKGGDLTRYLTLASTAAQSAAALIKRLLAFSRKQTLDLQALDVNAAIAQMEDMLRRTIGEQIQFELALQPGLPSVKSDRNQLENALLNLTINARDAMPEGGVIRISTSRRELDVSYSAMHPEVTPGHYVMVSVSDDGTGMSPEVIAKAFDPFFTTKPIGQGTGLGLSMIYGFARQTRGHASIHSVEGAGTTVNVYLPCNLTSSEAPVTQQQLVARSPKGRGETVLFVEDEPGVRAVLAEILGELGYITYEAIDAPSALAIEQSLGHLDLLITDVGLPGTNGRQLAEMMRERRPGLRVLFVTGYANKAAIKNEFLGRGMDMLAKPFTIDALAHKVQTMLNEPMSSAPVPGLDGAADSTFGELV